MTSKIQIKLQTDITHIITAVTEMRKENSDLHKDIEETNKALNHALLLIKDMGMMIKSITADENDPTKKVELMSPVIVKSSTPDTANLFPVKREIIKTPALAPSELVLLDRLILAKSLNGTLN